MANSKRKCRECKQYGRREEMIITPSNVAFCNDGCAARHAIKKIPITRQRQKKNERREIARRKRELKPISHWLNETQKVFNEYIRLRDQREPCISCGKLDAPEWCAGHYRSRGAASQLRFNEDNVHKQCNKNCNLELSGNIAEYRPRLVAKIGLARVEALENDNSTKKWTREELDELRAYYRDKIRELKKEAA